MYKCSIVNCEGKLFNPKEPCTVYGLPRQHGELKKWLEAIPSPAGETINLDNFRICKRHWPLPIHMVKDVGGGYRPATPPSIFRVLPLCSPTPDSSLGEAKSKLHAALKRKIFSVHMVPNRCCIETCKNKYQDSQEVSLYRLPRKLEDEQSWVEVISKHIRPGKNINRESIRICRQHWPADTPMVKVRGGTSHPLEPPSIFNHASPRLLVVTKQEVEQNGRIIEISGPSSNDQSISIISTTTNNEASQQTNQRRKSSFVWRFFSKPYYTKDQMYADCSRCKTAVKTASVGPTISLNRHLKTVHNLTHDSWLMKCNMLKSLPSEQVVARLYCETQINFLELASSDILRALFANAGLDLPFQPKQLREQFMGQAQLVREQLEAQCLKHKAQSKLFCVTIGKLADGPFVSLNVHAGANVYSLGVLGLHDFSIATVGEMVKGRLKCYGIDADKDVIGITTDGVATVGQVAEQWAVHQSCVSHAIHLAVRDLIYTKITPDDDVDEGGRAERGEYLDSYGNVSAKQAMQSKAFIDYKIMDHWKELVEKVRNDNQSSDAKPNSCFWNNYDSSSWEGLYAIFNHFLRMKENQPARIDEAGMKQIRDLTEVLTVMKELADKCIAKTATLLEIDDRVLYTLEILAESASAFGPSLYDSLCRHYLERRNTPLVHLMTFLENHEFLKKPEDDFALSIKRADIEGLAETLIRKHFPLEIAAPVVEGVPLLAIEATIPLGLVKPAGLQSFEAWRYKKRRKTTDNSASPQPDRLIPLKLAFDEYLYSGVRPKMLNLLHDALGNFPPTSIECEKSFAILKQVTKKAANGMSPHQVNDMLVSGHYFKYNHKFELVTEAGNS